MRTAMFMLVGVMAMQPCTPRARAATFVEDHGRLAVRGTGLVDVRGEPVVLRGMSLGWHNWWPQYWNEDVVRWMRDDWRCTVLRAAMGVENDKGYLTDPETSKRLAKTVVEACIQSGLYVILDWHDHRAEQHVDQAKAFFAEMAGTYGRYPNVLYEIYNEPLAVPWDTVKTYSRQVIAAIREKDPDNVILVGCPHWDQDVHLVADAPIPEVSNVMYTLHFYAATHKESLRERADYALNKGIPLFVSEYGGCEASGNGPLDMDQWKAWVDWMEARRISWCVWSIADKDETCSVLVKGASPKGGWTEKDLKPSGLHARDLLRSLNP
ncbi:MAG: glycoside hydrolase family 5 protein [Phycisphaerae bacterium]|nr:glycoside hydrolase family 5 protein [Phycisphaerae bacterium]